MNLRFNEELTNIYNKLGLNEAKKPDFLDVNKNGDTKEPLADAIKDAKKVKRCSCGCIIGNPKKGCTCKKHHKKK